MAKSVSSYIFFLLNICSEFYKQTKNIYREESKLHIGGILTKCIFSLPRRIIKRYKKFFFFLKRYLSYTEEAL
jgi:hypothetical protein